MVLILDGSTEHCANIWRKSGISKCVRHSVTLTESSNPNFFRIKPTLLHTYATCSELPSYISTMVLTDAHTAGKKERDKEGRRGGKELRKNMITKTALFSVL